MIRGYEDPRQSSIRFSDTQQASDCIVLAFTMKSGVNIVDLNDQMNDLLALHLNRDWHDRIKNFYNRGSVGR